MDVKIKRHATLTTIIGIAKSVFVQWSLCNDDVIKWKHFPRYWPFVRGIHRSPVNSPHKDQRGGALMFSLICALNKRLSKQSWGWWFDTLIRDDIVIKIISIPSMPHVNSTQIDGTNARIWWNQCVARLINKNGDVGTACTSASARGGHSQNQGGCRNSLNFWHQM